MQRPTSKRSDKPDILNGMSDKQTRAKWLEFVLFCFEASDVRSIVDPGLPEANRQRLTAKSNKYLEATAHEMHKVVFRGNCVLQALIHACSTPRYPDIHSRYLGI